MGPALAGLLLAMVPAVAGAFELPPELQLRPVLIPGHYACLDGKVPTSEFDILDGTAYFLRGNTLRAGDFAYDKATSVISWTSGPFADADMVGYNTTRTADKMPVIVLHFASDGEAPSTELCAILE
jgi:hypothetical protein